MEVVLGGVIPVIILPNRPFRRRHGIKMTGLALIVFGVIVNRWNVTLSGLVVPPSWSPGVLGNTVVATYTPSWVELAVIVGVLGYALLALTLGLRHLPLFPEAENGEG